MFAEDEADLLLGSAGTPQHLAALVDQRVSGLPLEHVLGWADFCGLRIAVAAGVFVPRPRSELLARTAARLVTRPETVVVDLCCGSGALGAVVAATAAHSIHLYAADLDPAAVACARENLETYGGRVFLGDLLDALPGDLQGRVEVLVANVPYVPSDAIELLPPEARLHEPRLALDGGGDGLDVLRRVALAATAWLAPGGHLLVETSDRQLETAERIVRDAGLVPIVARDDDLEATVLVARWPAPLSRSGR